MKYVTYLITYTGSKLPKHYIGSTSEDKISKGYMGSIKSKKWKSIYLDEIKNNKNLFHLTIINSFDDRNSALLDEYELHKKYDVVKSPMYFNESFANVNGYFGRDVSGSLNPMYGRTDEVIAINTETKEKIRITKEEFDTSDNYKGHSYGMKCVYSKIESKNIYINISDYDENIHVNMNQGIKHSKETKEKLSKQRQNMITARDWDGNFHRVYKDDIRFENGTLGNTTSKRWLITDLDNNVYKTLNLKGFFNKNGLRFPLKKNIINGVITFFRKSSTEYKCTNGWQIKCLD